MYNHVLVLLKTLLFETLQGYNSLFFHNIKIKLSNNKHFQPYMAYGSPCTAEKLSE